MFEIILSNTKIVPWFNNLARGVGEKYMMAFLTIIATCQKYIYFKHQFPIVVLVSKTTEFSTKIKLRSLNNFYKRKNKNSWMTSGKSMLLTLP